MRRWHLALGLFLAGLLLTLDAGAHVGTLDAYGCHSDKALFGTTAKRECHTGLLAGQVFASATAEYKAYIAAQQVLLAAQQTTVSAQQTTITTQQASLADLTTKLAACTARCPVVPPPPPVTGSLTLTWNANTESDLAGYKAYCGLTSHTYTLSVSLGKVVTTTFGNLPTGKTYYCAVTAFDTANHESGFSNEVNKVLP